MDRNGGSVARWQGVQGGGQSGAAGGCLSLGRAAPETGARRLTGCLGSLSEGRGVRCRDAGKRRVSRAAAVDLLLASCLQGRGGYFSNRALSANVFEMRVGCVSREARFCFRWRRACEVGQVAQQENSSGSTLCQPGRRAECRGCVHQVKWLARRSTGVMRFLWGRAGVGTVGTAVDMQSALVAGIVRGRRGLVDGVGSQWEQET